MRRSNFSYIAALIFVSLVLSSPVLSHEEGNAEQILRKGDILFASKTNHEHIFTVVFSKRIWACSVKTIGNWVGEGVGGVVCHSNGIDAENFDILEHLEHD